MSVTDNFEQIQIVGAEDRLQAAKPGRADCKYPFHPRLFLGFQQIGREL